MLLSHLHTAILFDITALYKHYGKQLCFILFSHKINLCVDWMILKKRKNRQIGIQYFDQYFYTRKNLLVQIFWPRILKFSLALSVNAGLISDPAVFLFHQNLFYNKKNNVQTQGFSYQSPY